MFGEGAAELANTLEEANKGKRFRDEASAVKVGNVPNEHLDVLLEETHSSNLASKKLKLRVGNSPKQESSEDDVVEGEETSSPCDS